MKKSQVQENLTPFSVLCDYTFTAHWNVKRRVGRPSPRVHLQTRVTKDTETRGSPAGNGSLEGPITGKKPLEFHVVVSCRRVLTWSPHAGDPASVLGPLSLRCSADVTHQFANPDSNHESTRKWSHNSNWNNLRKVFHEAAGTENDY